MKIEDGDQGFLVPHVVYRGRRDWQRWKKRVKVVGWHRECLFMNIVGTPRHLEGTCTCRSGAEPLPQTPQERRADALAVWERYGRGG